MGAAAGFAVWAPLLFFNNKDSSLVVETTAMAGHLRDNAFVRDDDRRWMDGCMEWFSVGRAAIVLQHMCNLISTQSFASISTEP